MSAPEKPVAIAWRMIRRYAWAGYLGIVTSAAGWGPLSWKFWAAVIPLIILKLISERAARTKGSRE